MRRWSILAITLVLAVLAAAWPLAAQDKPRNGGELIFVVPSEPPSYDGHQEETFGVMHPIALPAGCRFHPRCPFVEPRCREAEPPLTEVAPGQHAACWRAPLDRSVPG